MNVIVTGGAGFIGSNFIRYLTQHHPSYKVINVDSLTYAGNIHNLHGMEYNPNYMFVKGSITNRELIVHLIKKHSANIIVNFAAESHVDRSIHTPLVFTESNIQGTHALLEAARECGVDKYIQISTDEVYGSLGETGYFTEETPLSPNSPYSASKAGADLLVRAYHETYGMNVNITRCSNNYGPYHFPEKLIPLMITNGIDGELLPIYGDGEHIRDWLHVTDHCSAIDTVMHQGRCGEVYNVGGHNERTNNEVVRIIADKLNLSADRIQYVKDRPGHDRRYAIDARKLETELGWRPKYTFETGLVETINWYVEHESWWRPLRNRAKLERYSK